MKYHEEIQNLHGFHLHNLTKYTMQSSYVTLVAATTTSTNLSVPPRLYGVDSTKTLEQVSPLFISLFGCKTQFFLTHGNYLYKFMIREVSTSLHHPLNVLQKASMENGSLNLSMFSPSREKASVKIATQSLHTLVTRKVH